MEIINTLFLSSLGVGACTMGDFSGVLLLRSDSFSWCEYGGPYSSVAPCRVVPSSPRSYPWAHPVWYI